MSPEQIFTESAKFIEVLVYFAAAIVVLGLSYVVFFMFNNTDFSED
jgi:hypothetical protein